MAYNSLSRELKAQIAQLAAANMTKTEVAAQLALSGGTVRKYWPIAEKPLPQSPVPPTSPPSRLPDPFPEAGGPTLPDAVIESYDPFKLADSGRWLYLSDIHLPYHDKRTIEVAVAEAKRLGIVGVLLNGDVMDCYEISNHSRDPNTGRFVDEVKIARRFLEWLRSQFPAARIVWKAGNHEDRLPRYMQQNAPALDGLPGFDLPTVVELVKHGVEWVDGGRVIEMGKLHVVHGHEFRGGGGVNPARWLFLRTVSTSMCGHFHRTSEHHESATDRRFYGVWSVGCACYLTPVWLRQNKWNHGFAFIDLAGDGGFHVTNRRLQPDGRLL